MISFTWVPTVLKWLNALLGLLRYAESRDRVCFRSYYITVDVDVRLLVEGETSVEGAMPYAPEETLRRIGWELWDSHCRINRLLGKELPYNLRIPFQCSVGGWEFEGVWQANPVLGPERWKLEGLLELPPHQPERFCVCGGPRGCSPSGGEGSGG